MRTFVRESAAGFLLVLVALVGACFHAPSVEAHIPDGGAGDDTVPCAKDFSGVYRVVAVATDSKGCAPGGSISSASSQRIAIEGHDGGAQFVSTCRDPDADGCGGLKSVDFPSLTMSDDQESCVGISRESVVLERPDGVLLCTDDVYRLTISGDDPVTLVQERFEHLGGADATGQCPAHPEWARGENLPECKSASRLTLELVQ